MSKGSDVWEVEDETSFHEVTGGTAHWGLRFLLPQDDQGDRQMPAGVSNRAVTRPVLSPGIGLRMGLGEVWRGVTSSSSSGVGVSRWLNPAPETCGQCSHEGRQQAGQGTIYTPMPSSRSVILSVRMLWALSWAPETQAEGPQLAP